MLAKTESIETDAQDWLARFEQALARATAALAALFHPDSYWRDVLAFTWDIRTVHGADAIVRALQAQRAPRRRLSGSTRSAPRRAR